jgi:hypothetical protein
MTGLSDVFGSLQTMTQLQLLLAFVACIGYAFAQGSLIARKGRRLAWLATSFAAVGFAFESDDWTHATVLLGFALAGMGSFVAIVWLTSRAIGFGTTPPVARADAVDSEASGLSPLDSRPLPPSPRDHAHSV